jgi:peptidoglycan hydrolase CwlO-like protein
VKNTYLSKAMESYFYRKLNKKLNLIILKLNDMALTNEQVLQRLAESQAQLEKAKAEILAKIAELGIASPELEAMVNSLGQTAQSLDDIVPDAPLA